MISKLIDRFSKDESDESELTHACMCGSWFESQESLEAHLKETHQ